MMEVASVKEAYNFNSNTKAITPYTLGLCIHNFMPTGGGGDNTPIGTQMIYSSSVIPVGYLPCDGSAVSRTTYQELFAVIGVHYGVGDGSTTFNLPNKNGRVSVGLDTTQPEFNTLGKKGGEKVHANTSDENGPHRHNYREDGRRTVAPCPEGWVTNYDLVNINQGYGGYRLELSPYVAISGLGKPHNNLQPYEVDQWIIKAFSATQQNPVKGSVNDTMPAGGVIQFDGNYVPEGYEEVSPPSPRTFYKELAATVSGHNGVAYQNLGDLYLDIPKGRWLITIMSNLVTSGNGAAFCRLCISKNVNSPSDKRYVNDINITRFGSSLTYMIELEQTTRIYFLHAFAYTGNNVSCRLEKGDGYYSPIPYIEAVELK